MAARHGEFADSAEVLTPVIRDPPSLIPLLRAATALLARPASAAQISGHTIAAFRRAPRLLPRPGASYAARTGTGRPCGIPGRPGCGRPADAPPGGRFLALMAPGWPASPAEGTRGQLAAGR